MSINLASSQSSIVTDSLGVSHIVWADNGNIWYAVYDSNSETWKDAEVIAFTDSEPVTSINFVANDKLIDGQNPGLAVVWQQGNLNDSDFFYTASQYDNNADLQWLDTPQALTSDQVGDLEPTVTVNDSGEVIVIGSKVNFDNVTNLSIKEDTDFYSQQFSVSSSQFPPNRTNIAPLAPYSPQLTTDGLVNLGVLTSSTPTTQEAVQSSTESEGFGISSETEQPGQQPVGSWNTQLSFASSLLEDWKLMHSVPEDGFLRTIINPFMKNWEIVGTISGGQNFGWGNSEASIFLKTNAQLEWKSSKLVTSPWKFPTVNYNSSETFGNLFADDSATVPKGKVRSPITFGFDLDSRYDFAPNSPYDLINIDDKLSLSASVKLPIISDIETAGFFSLDATGSLGINFNFLGEAVAGETYSPQTLLAGITDLEESILGSAFIDGAILAINLAKEGTTEGSGAGIIAAEIAFNVADTIVAFINGTVEGLDPKGSISFPVLSTGLVGKAQIPHVPILSADINGGVTTALNWGIGNTDNTISLTFPIGFEVKVGPLGFGFNFNPSWYWDILDSNKDSTSNVSAETASSLATTSQAQVRGSLLTIELDSTISALPDPDDFIVTVTDINGNNTPITVFNVIQGNSPTTIVLQLESSIVTSENLDYTTSDNPTPSSNTVSLSFTNNEGITDSEGTVIESFSDLNVTNATPNTLNYTYNPTSGNSQNHSIPTGTTLFLAFNTPLDTESTYTPEQLTLAFDVIAVPNGFPIANGGGLPLTSAQITTNGILITFYPTVTGQSLQDQYLIISYDSTVFLFNPLQDINGNSIESFTVQSGTSTQVSNNSIVTANPPLAVDVATQSLMANIEADLGQDSSPVIISGGSSPLLAWVADAPPLEAIAGFVNGQIVTLNFIDELGNGTDVPSIDQFIVTDSDNNTYTVKNVSVDGNSLTLTLDTAVSADTDLNISYSLSTPTAKNNNLFLKNSFTNTTLWINDFSDFELNNTTANTNPPVILGAGSIVETNTSNQITLVFDQTLINNGVSNSDFTVESNGQVYSIGTNVTVNDNTVILTVQPPEGANLIGNGDIVTVSYTGDSLSSGTSSNGNVANFSNQPVITSPTTPTTVIKYALLDSSDQYLVSNINSIPGTGGFNFNPVGAYDKGNIVLVWSNADSSDINTNLVPGEFYTDNETSLINESFNQSDIYYSIYTPSPSSSTQQGSWTVASPIAQQEGSEGKIVIGEGPNNQLMTAWINYNNGESTIYWSSLAYNNGEATWSNPEILYADANPDPLTELSIVTIDSKPTVLWTETQGTSYSQLTLEESPLLYYRLAETSGTTLVNEGIYGAGGNGTYSGSVTFNEVGALEDTTTNQGDANPAVLFNKGNSAASSTIPLSGTSFSVEFWFKVPSVPSDTLTLVTVNGLMTVSLDNSGVSLNINNTPLNSSGFTPSANEWSYVVASYNGETNIANLYVNGENVGSLDSVYSTIPSNTNTSLLLASSSNNSSVYLDEVAFYRKALTYNDIPDISDFGNLTPSQISQILLNTSQIGNKYNSQYIPPLPSGPNTNYVSYDGDSWSPPSVIDPTDKPIATQLSDANKAQWDVTSFTSANSSGYVNPNGNPDIFLTLNLGNQVTGTKISSIEVTANNVTWSVGNTNGNQLAVVQGDKLLNPVNPDGSFDYTILSPSVDLDLFLDAGDNDFSSSTTFNVTINYSNGTSTPPSPTTLTLQEVDVTSEPTDINSNQVLGIATVTEANDSSLALIDSGFIINTNNPSIGYSIVSADFNNDGKSDVAVGNRGYTNTSGTQLKGTIQILFGGEAVLSNNETNPLTTTDLTGNPNGVLITGLSDTGQANGDYPFSMATGDVDGDGVEDLVIGDPNANQVYVIYGSKMTAGATIDVTNLGSQGYIINAPNPNNENPLPNIGFGYSVAVGNFNSNAQSNGTYAYDTKFDIAIGAPGANNGNGAVYVAFDGNATYSTIYDSTNTGELAGYSLAVSSRTAQAKTFTDNANSDDLIIGAIGYEGTVTNQWNGLSGLPSSTNENPAGQSYPSTSTAEIGAVYVYQSNGTENLTEYASYTGSNLPSSNGTANDTNTGSAITSADLDADGINDLAISAPGGANNNGLIYVVKGGITKNSNPQNLDTVANLGIVGGLPFSQTGAIITSPGDVNGDRYEDFLITAPQGANGTGQSYVLFGPLNLSEIGTIFDLNVTATDSKTTFLLNGSQPYQLVGAAASGIGDVNGDGVDDLMISAPNAGQLYTIFGHPWLADDGSIKLANISGDNGFVIDGDLYTTDVDTKIHQIPNQTTNIAPSLINDNGTLYLAYTGGNSQIYLTTSSNNGMTWSSAIELPSDMTTNVSPSITFYNDVLYLAYQGTNNQLNIAYSTDNGKSWSDSDSSTLDQYSAAGFSLVEYGGELMVFFVSTATDNNILYVTSDNPQSSSSWSNAINVTNPTPADPDQQASDMISATVLNNTLYLAYRGGTVGSGNNYYVTHTNNSSNLSDLTWQVSEVSNLSNPNTAPSLTNNGSQLYFTYADTSEIIYTTTSGDGSNWSTPQKVSNQTTKYTPSGAFLNGQLYLGYTGDNQDIYVTGLEGSIPLVGNGNNVVMLGDVNGDGFADVLSGGSASGGVLIFGNSTTNLIDAAVGTDDILITVKNQTISEFVALGDINGDGLQDFGVIDNNNNFYVQLGSRSLPTLGSSIELSNVLKSSISNGVAIGDYNGDGYDDVMLATTENNTNIYFGNSQGNLSESVSLGSGTFAPVGDINGDGYSDLSYQSSSLETSTSIGYANGFNNLEIYYGNSSSSSTAQAFLNTTNAPFYGTNTGKAINRAGDFNGDGIPDMMISAAQPVGLIVVETSDSKISFAYFNHFAIDWDKDTSVTLDVQTTTHTYSTSDETMGLASYNNDWFFAHSEDYIFWLSGSDVSQDGENSFGSQYDYAKPQLVTANGNLYMIVAGWNSNNPYISLYNSSNNSWQSPDSSTEEDSLTNSITNTNGNDVVSAAIESNIYIAWTHSSNLYYGYWDTDNSTYTDINNVALSSIITNNNAGNNDPLSMTVLNGTLYLALRDGNNNAWMTTYDTNSSSPSWSRAIEMKYTQGNRSIEAEESSVTLTTLSGEVYATWYDVNEIVTDSKNVYLTKYDSSSSSWTNSLLLNNGTTPLDITGNGDFPGLTPFVWSAQTSVVLGDTAKNASNMVNINGLTGNFSEATATTDPTQSPYSSLGDEITFIGDINGDGFDDILIAAPNYNNNQGGVFVVFGTDSNESINLENLTPTQGFAIQGLPSSLAGISVSGGEDVNGDGFEDLIIGAPGDNDNLTYVIFGSDFNNTVTQTGTIGDDVMVGTATGESFIGGEGNDQIYTNGGIDVVYAGPGDDLVTVNDTYFRRLDGGAGTDVLRFEGYNGQDWDLTTLSPGSRLRNFEILVTEDYGANTLTLNSLTVTQLSPTNTVTVVMDKNDTLNLSADFTKDTVTVYQYNQKFDRYTSGASTVLLNRIVETDTTNVITVTKNATSTNTPTSNLTSEVASVSAETMTSFSFDESGNSTAQSFASSLFSATASDSNAPTRLSVSNPIANEADGEVEFIIQRTGDLDKYVQVHYLTQDGRGKGGSHYNPVLGRAVFKPGETTKTVAVPLILDDIHTGTRDLGLLVTLEKESDTILDEEHHLYVDVSNGQIRNWNHIIKDQPNSVMGGKLEFRVTTTDGKAQVKVYFEGNKDFNSYYIFNNETQQYEPFTGAQLFDEDGDGKNDGAILNLQDGSEHDLDGGENGIIFKRGFFADGETPEILLDTAMYRFRSVDTMGSYLYVDAQEKESLLTSYSNSFVEEGLAFHVSDTQEDGLIAFNRFRNTDLMGAYIYAGEAESESIRSNYPQFIEEGIAFYAYGADSQMADSITRFQNNTGGAYLYTGQPETENVINNYTNNFNLEGIAFEALLA